MKKAKIIEWKKHGDSRGGLVAIEGGSSVPFEIKRIFYMDGMERATVRAKHANRNSRIIFVPVAGTCKIAVDDGVTREVFDLTKNNAGLYCEPMTWKEMYDFSPNCVLMGISDRIYDAGEYISDYAAFKKESCHE